MLAYDIFFAQNMPASKFLLFLAEAGYILGGIPMYATNYNFPCPQKLNVGFYFHHCKHNIYVY